MKKINLLVGIFCVVFLTNCKKAAFESQPVASLNVINAIIDGKVVRINTALRDSAAIMNFKLFGLNAAAGSSLRAYASSNPNNPYFDQTVSIENGGIYSLFLTGSAIAPESLFIKDNIPALSADSAVMVRVVNLSPNLGPLTLTLASASGVNQFSGVAYKNITDFKSFPLKLVVPAGSSTPVIPVGSVSFQIRDDLNVIKATYTLPATGTVSIASSRFKSITLIVKGMVGGTGTNNIGVFAMPNY